MAFSIGEPVLPMLNFFTGSNTTLILKRPLKLISLLIIPGLALILFPGFVPFDGYRSVINYNGGFIAVGSEGRIDQISASGKIMKSVTFPGENFNCAHADNKMVIAAGNKGIFRISYDGEVFKKIDIGSERNINSLSIFNGIIIAGADNGIIITVDQHSSVKETRLNLRGNIVSVSARSTDCYGVTNEGEIIHSKDGINWDIIDFNKVYSGYYPTCYFKKVTVTDTRIAVTGIQKNGEPVLMFSNQGGVWTERPLYYTDDQGVQMFLTDQPNDIIYDETTDQFYLVCNKGKLMQIPSCSHCNKVMVLDDNDLEGVSMNENTMIIVGAKYIIKTVDLK